jgi:hypothetical protein
MHRPATAPPLAPLRASAGVRAVLAPIAVVAIALPALVVTLAPPLPVEKAVRRVPKPHVVPPAELPPVEPLRLVALTPDEARAYNASIPFSTAPNPAARPFHLAGAEADRQRAIACLAAAEVYEAGDDAAGEKAVAQVVLNRLRHPAFPKTVCGVVFQGAERSTGCQFTFTCDGALDRWKPSHAAWDRARDIASKALDGMVDKAVGYATHYHTDWVVPYWSASLDKIARVGAHLFFRWSGWWGTPPAFNRHVDGDEPMIALLAPLSPAHAAATTDPDDAALPLDAAAIANGGLPRPLAGDPDTFLVALDPDWPADSLPALAAASCGERPYCKFMAWRSKADTPTAQPITPQQIATMAFSYLRDTPHGYDKPLWNCDAFKRADTSQCMKRQPVPPPSPKVVAVAPLPQPKPTTDGLAGVRWKLDPIGPISTAPAPSH